MVLCQHLEIFTIILLKKNNSNDLTDSDTINKPQSLNKRAVTFKYNLGKKHKVVSVLIKNVSTRKKNI